MCNVCILRVGQKSKPVLIYQEIVLKPANEAAFSLKLNIEQATKVNANIILYILSIKYSMYDVKCDVNYCVSTLQRSSHLSICY